MQMAPKTILPNKVKFNYITSYGSIDTCHHEYVFIVHLLLLSHMGKRRRKKKTYDEIKITFQIKTIPNCFVLSLGLNYMMAFQPQS